MNKPIKEYQVKVEVDSCLTMLPDFTYNYANYNGFSTSKDSGNTVVSNFSNGFLYSFDVATGKLISKFEVESEGPLSPGGIGRFDAVFNLSSDMILYSSNSENKVFLISRDSAFAVVDYSSSDDYRLMGSFQNTPIESNEHFLFPVYRGKNKVRGSRYTYVAIDRNLKKYQEVFDASFLYKNKYYGNFPYFYWPSVTFNSLKQTYFVSYPVSHSIYEYSLNFELLKEYKIFHEEIGEVPVYNSPLDENGNPDHIEMRAYYKNTSHFLKLHYLPGRNQYIRFVRTFDIENGSWDYYLIIYSGDFDKSKLVKIDNGYSVFNSFPFEDRLFMLNKERMTSERTVSIPFDCFSFISGIE